MSGNPERQSIEQRSALGAALSFEFECSFAAAEANKAAYQLLDKHHRSHAIRAGVGEVLPYFKMHVPGERMETQASYVISLDAVDLEAEQPVRLALIEPVHRTSKEVVFKKMLRRHVRTEYVEEKGEPVLAAMFDDIALPLATFARRKDGTCSYIQLGSEIADDNFHVLASDDAAGRSAVIEAIRRLIDCENSDYRIVGSTAEKTKHALQSLLNNEIEHNKEQLAEAFEAQLVRMCSPNFEQDSVRRLAVLDGTDEVHDDRYTVKQILEDTLLDGDRSVSLVAGRPVGSAHQDISQLFAVTRGIVALPVTQLNTSTGQLSFENDDLSNNFEQRKSVVYSLLAALRGELSARHTKIDPLYFLQKAETGDSRRQKASKGIARVIAGNELVQEDGRVIVSEANQTVDAVFAHYFRVYSKSGHFLRDELPDIILQGRHEITEAIRATAYRFINHPLTTTNPYPDSKVLKVYGDRVKTENDRRKAVLDQLGVTRRLEDSVGDTSLAEENLAQTLYDMAATSPVHTGVIENVNMNNTRANAIFEVSIDAEGSQLFVTVKGKPEAMTDEPLKVLSPFCFSFDASRPIYEQLKGTRAHIGELLTMFEALTPANSHSVIQSL